MEVKKGVSIQFEDLTKTPKNDKITIESTCILRSRTNHRAGGGGTNIQRMQKCSRNLEKRAEIYENNTYKGQC